LLNYLNWSWRHFILLRIWPVLVSNQCGISIIEKKFRFESGLRSGQKHRNVNFSSCCYLREHNFFCRNLQCRFVSCLFCCIELIGFVFIDLSFTKLVCHQFKTRCHSLDGIDHQVAAITFSHAHINIPAMKILSKWLKAHDWILIGFETPQ